MVRRNVCVDNHNPKEAMRIEVSTEDFNEVVYVSRDVFKSLFGVEARESLFLEIDIEDVTEARRANVRAIHERMGLRSSGSERDE